MRRAWSRACRCRLPSVGALGLSPPANAAERVPEAVLFLVQLFEPRRRTVDVAILGE